MFNCYPTKTEETQDQQETALEPVSAPSPESEPVYA